MSTQSAVYQLRGNNLIQIFMSICLFEHLLVSSDSWFLAITLIYVIDIVVRWFGLGFRSFKANGWNIFDVIVAVGALTTTVIDRSGSQSFLIAQLQKLFLVSIAFKLVQRTNSLNQLFKTAMCVLISILSNISSFFIGGAAEVVNTLFCYF